MLSGSKRLRDTEYGELHDGYSTSSEGEGTAREEAWKKGQAHEETLISGEFGCVVIGQTPVRLGT